MIQMGNSLIQTALKEGSTSTGIKEGNPNSANAFLNILESFHVKEQVRTEASDKKPHKMVEKEQYQELLNDMLTKLLSMEESDAYLENQMLQNEENIDLLAQLPEEMQLLIEEIAEKGGSVETSLEKLKEHPALGELLAVMMQAEADDADGKSWAAAIENEMSQLLVLIFPDLAGQQDLQSFSAMKEVLLTEDLMQQANPALMKQLPGLMAAYNSQEETGTVEFSQKITAAAQLLQKNHNFSDVDSALLVMLETTEQIEEMSAEELQEVLSLLESLLINSKVADEVREELSAFLTQETQMSPQEIEALLGKGRLSAEAVQQLPEDIVNTIQQFITSQETVQQLFGQLQSLVKETVPGNDGKQNSAGSFPQNFFGQFRNGKAKADEASAPLKDNVQNRSETAAQDTKFSLNTFDKLSREIPVVQQNVPLAQQQLFTQMFSPQSSQQAARPNQEALLKQFETLLSKSTFKQLQNGVQQLTLKLHPVSMGRLDITIQQVNGVMTARIMTTTQMAKDMLDSQLHQLKQAFQGQNLQVERVETAQQQAQLWKDMQEEQKEKQQQKDKEPSDQLADEEDEEQNFAEFLQATIDEEA